jgi:hypothetical protein
MRGTGLSSRVAEGFRQREMLQASSGALTFDKVQAQYPRTAIATRLRQLGMANEENSGGPVNDAERRRTQHLRFGQFAVHV